jgi:hypothetical protein
VTTRPGAGRGGRGSGRDGTVALNLGSEEDGPRRSAHLTWASIPGTDNAAERRFDADVVPPHGGQRLALVPLSSLAPCTSTRQPTIFYRIFYRIVRHRAFGGGRVQHGTVAKAQVSAPIRPEAISAVTPTKQLITRRSRVQIPPPPPNRRPGHGRVPVSRHPSVVLGVQPFATRFELGPCVRARCASPVHG